MIGPRKSSTGWKHAKCLSGQDQILAEVGAFARPAYPAVSVHRNTGSTDAFCLALVLSRISEPESLRVMGESRAFRAPGRNIRRGSASVRTSSMRSGYQEAESFRCVVSISFPTWSVKDGNSCRNLPKYPSCSRTGAFDIHFQIP